MAFANRESVQQRIKDDALALFVNDGIARTSVAAICVKAGVANGSFYNFFADKQALLAAIENDAATTLMALLARRETPIIDPIEEQRRDTAIIVDFAEQHRELFLFSIERHRHRSERGALIEQFTRQRTSEIMARQADGRYLLNIDPRTAALAEISVTLDLLVDWLDTTNREPSRVMIDRLTTLRSAMLMARQ